jgi:TM2 domain-containing membrane protein YozV
MVDGTADMDQKTKEEIAAELAAEYRTALRETAAEEQPRHRAGDYRSGGRSLRTAYFLWFLLGGFGAHRIYLKRLRTGAIMGTLGICSTALSISAPMLEDLALAMPLLAWWVIDGFLIPSLMEDKPTG